MSFPDLQPTARAWVGGAPGQGSFVAASGIEVRTLFGANAYGQVLTLNYSNITEDNARLFDDHYTSSRGSFTAFTLPFSTYAGMSQQFAPANTTWRYGGPPEIESVQPNRHNVSVSLICVSG